MNSQGSSMNSLGNMTSTGVGGALSEVMMEWEKPYMEKCVDELGVNSAV